MRRFFVPIITIALISAATLTTLLIFASPYSSDTTPLVINKKIVTLFLVLLFFFLTSTLSLLLYLFYRLLGDSPQPRLSLRRALRHAALFSISLVVVAALKLTNTFNLITVALTLLVVITLEFAFH